MTSAARADALDSMVRGLMMPAAEAERRAIRRRIADARSHGSFSSSESGAAGYLGADNRRNWADWKASIASANYIMSRDFEVIRARARERADRNDGFAQNAINQWVDHTIGATIKPQVRVNARRLGVTQAVADEWQTALEEEFQEWASEPVDLEQNLDFPGVAKLAVRRMCIDGEYCAQQVVRDGYICVESIDAARLSDPSLDIRRSVTSGGAEVQLGIERAASGRLVAYWVANRQVVDLSTWKPRAWTRVPRRDANGVLRFLHCFDPNNSGQLRGISALCYALRYLKLVDDIQEAELLGKRAESSIGVIRERQVNAQTLFEEMDEEDDESPVIRKWEPVMDIEGLPGETIKLVDPHRPGNSYAPFMNQTLIAISAATSMPLHALTNDFSKTNYSSGKLAQQNFLRRIGSHQRPIAVRTVCNPMLRAVAVLAWANGRLPNVPLLENLNGWTRAVWFAQGHDWVEVLKEAQAEELAINNNLKTLAQVCAERGLDWEEVLKQRAIEVQRQRELGITPPKTTPKSSNGQERDDASEDRDDESDERDEDDNSGDGDTGDE